MSSSETKNEENPVNHNHTNSNTSETARISKETESKDYEHKDVIVDLEVDSEKVDSDRLKTNSLLDSSDPSLGIYDKPVVIDDWSEAVFGWKPLSHYPQYTLAARKRKTNDNDFNGVVRCVNDNDSDHHLMLWRSSVEPTTFRYVPNNATYRLTKFSQAGRDWYTIRKIKPEKVAIKEPEPNKQVREGRSKRRIPGKKTELRSRSTNSDGALNRLSVLNETRTQSDYGQPHLSKSATDLLMENLGSRLDQLENQVRKNIKNCKRNSLDNQSTGSSEKGQSKKINTNTVKLKTNVFAENSSFSSNFISKNLRPLEKVTPKQRIKIGLSKNVLSTKAHDTSKNSSITTSLNNGSSVTFEGVDSEELPSIDGSGKFDSYLLGKGKSILRPSANSLTTTSKNTGAILKYTTASSHLKSKKKFWNNSTVDNNELMEPNNMPVANLPEVSGKHIPVTFSNQRLLRQ